MKRIILLCSIAGALTLTSCGSKKKIAELEERNKEIQDMLNSTTLKSNTCLAEKNSLQSQVDFLKEVNADLKRDKENITHLSSQGAANLEKSLESLREKDLKISRLQDALSKKDSVTLALVTSRSE